MELIVSDYKETIDTIVFQHLGVDTQFWAGHYGCKMAGGVIKIPIKSIKLNK